MSLKDQGNLQFKNQNFQEAINLYTQAINESPSDHTIFGNRSAAYHSLREFSKALEDAEKCIALKPEWSKGFQRKAMALQAMGRLDDALDAYSKGLELDEGNAQIRQGLN